MVIEKAKRLVEHKKDVVILLDSITASPRHHNVVPSSGKVLTGGVTPMRSSARSAFRRRAQHREGGSLSIIATALIDTGNRMDEVIFEEFKAPATQSLTRSQGRRQKRIPSPTSASRAHARKNCWSKDKLNKMWVLPHPDAMGTVDAMEFLLDKIKDPRQTKISSIR